MVKIQLVHLIYTIIYLIGLSPGHPFFSLYFQKNFELFLVNNGNFPKIYRSCPASEMTIFDFGLPVSVPRASISLTTLNEVRSRTRPKTTFFPSNQGVSVTVMKNWEPLLSSPALAIERIPAKTSNDFIAADGGVKFIFEGKCVLVWQIFLYHYPLFKCVFCMI